jgi:endonuclease YncB( thermonuclease family)
MLRCRQRTRWKLGNELDAFIARRPVDCSPVNLDQYGRTVAMCSIDGVGVAERLVRNGLALDWLGGYVFQGRPLNRSYIFVRSFDAVEETAINL